jgi:hypothetical protein
MDVHCTSGKYISELSKILQCRLWGRDSCLDSKGDMNVKSSWEGKTFQAKWRCRGGMHKEESWANSPNLLEETDIPPEWKIVVDVVCDSLWTKLSVNDSNAKEEIQEFVKNRFGLKAEAMVRHTPLSQAKILNGDVIVVTREEKRKSSLVKIHIQWGEVVKNPLIQSSLPIEGLRYLIERKFNRSVRRNQIPRPDYHTFQEDEIIVIEDGNSVTLATEDLCYKVKLSEDSEEEIMKKIKNIWWPAP